LYRNVRFVTPNRHTTIQTQGGMNAKGKEELSLRQIQETALEQIQQSDRRVCVCVCVCA